MEHVLYEHNHGRIVIGDNEAIRYWWDDQYTDELNYWRGDDNCLWCETQLDNNDVCIRIQDTYEQNRSVAESRLCIGHARKLFNALDAHDPNDNEHSNHELHNRHDHWYATYVGTHDGARRPESHCLWCKEEIVIDPIYSLADSGISTHENCISQMTARVSEALDTAMDNYPDDLLSETL